MKNPNLLNSWLGFFCVSNAEPPAWP